VATDPATRGSEAFAAVSRPPVRDDATVSELARPGHLAPPPPADAMLLVVAIVGVSTSAPLIAATAAPALAIAFWRNAMATGVLLPWSAASRTSRAELRGLRGRERRYALAAGVLLAAHFATWVPSVTYTSVASSTALVATQPVWAALLVRARGGSLPRVAWTGIGLAVLGAAVLTGADVDVSSRHLVGDLLALVGGAFAAAYVTAGGEARRSLGTTAYTTVCYGVCAVLLAVVCVVGRQHLASYPAATWVRLAALTVGAQLLGHSLINRVLRTTGPLVVSLGILFEVPGATIIAAIFLHQGVRLAQLPGALLLLAGIAVVIRGGGRAQPVE
jgi:drug/metabolite transporter (DMT)-like permease